MGVPHMVIVPRLVSESMRCSTLVMPRSAILCGEERRFRPCLLQRHIVLQATPSFGHSLSQSAGEAALRASLGPTLFHSGDLDAAVDGEQDVLRLHVAVDHVHVVVLVSCRYASPLTASFVYLTRSGLGLGLELGTVRVRVRVRVSGLGF
jgi:hypothetical protein